MASSDLIEIAAERFGWRQAEVNRQINEAEYASGDETVRVQFDSLGRIRWAMCAGHPIEGGINGVIEVFKAFSR